MEKPAKIRVLIVDDHLVVRMGLRSMIESQPDMEVAAEAGTGKEAIALYQQARPNLVLMDLRMPILGGVEATAQIRHLAPDANILILTTYDGDENIYRALQAGARGYILKDVPRDDFFRGIRAVSQGGYFIPEPVATRLAQRLPAEDLSARELEVLRLIAQGRSNKEIAEPLGLSENTVRNHVNSILAKLRVHDRTQAVTSALKRGILVLE